MSGCTQQSRSADQGDSRPILVLDNWWNVDYAKSACQRAGDAGIECNPPAGFELSSEDEAFCAQAARRKAACMPADPGGGIHDFLARLMTSFGASPGCKGIDVVNYGGPDAPISREAEKAMSATHWSLMLDFDPGQPSQSWTLVGPKSQQLDGKGNEGEIAGTVCAIVGGGGARIAN
jgi:hypothetical protein